MRFTLLWCCGGGSRRGRICRWRHTIWHWLSPRRQAGRALSARDVRRRRQESARPTALPPEWQGASNSVCKLPAKRGRDESANDQIAGNCGTLAGGARSRRPRYAFAISRLRPGVGEDFLNARQRVEPGLAVGRAPKWFFGYSPQQSERRCSPGSTSAACRTRCSRTSPGAATHHLAQRLRGPRCEPVIGKDVVVARVHATTVVDAHALAGVLREDGDLRGLVHVLHDQRLQVVLDALTRLRVLRLQRDDLLAEGEAAQRRLAAQPVNTTSSEMTSRRSCGRSVRAARRPWRRGPVRS